MNNSDQWIRKVGLFVYRNSDGKGLDLSAFQIRFNIFNADVESPNSATIRIYNPSQDTVNEIRTAYNGPLQTTGYNQVVLNAGYESGNYGVIFKGNIKQFRIGHESNVTTYLDILAGDGDIGYNQSIINTTLAKGVSNAEALKIASKAMGMEVNTDLLKTDAQHVLSIRGQVLMGMARAKVRNIATTLDASWSIENGVVKVTDYKGYAENEVVVLNAGTGLIGFPEQTEGGIKVKCLLNPRLRIGGAIQLDNKTINQLVEQDPQSAPVSFNSYNIYNLAPLSNDGRYRLFVVEYEGDTRGNEWYCNLIGLAVDETKPADSGVIGG